MTTSTSEMGGLTTSGSAQIARAALVLALACVAAPTARAQPPKDDQAEAVADFQQIVRASNAYAAVLQEALAVELFAIEGAKHAQAAVRGEGSSTQLTDWATSWRKELADKIVVLKAHRAALSFPDEALRDMARTNAQIASRSQAIRQFPSTANQEVADILNLVGAIDNDVSATTRREPAAADKLVLDQVDGMRIQFISEVTSAQLVEGVAGAGHPQYALAESMVASNRALVEIFSGLEAQLKHQDVDIDALAQRVHVYCAQARAEAEKVPSLAAASRSGLSGAPPEMRVRLNKAWDTYADSADVEVAMAGECDKMQAALSSGVSIPEALKAATRLKELAERRIALDGQRRADLVSSP
jgi:hypothetical protein